MKRTSTCCDSFATRQGLTTRWYECTKCGKRCTVQEENPLYKFQK